MAPATALVSRSADVIVVGAGLAGLVSASEAADAGCRVLLLDQEGEHSLGGQAFWSLGGLFMVNTPEQRRLGIRDSRELAMRDWMATAGFDRQDDRWPRQWAEAYVDFAAGEMRPWLHAQGLRWFPAVGWAERAAEGAVGGNSLPRFHVTWGTGPAVVEPFARRVRAHHAAGRLQFRFRHRVSSLEITNGVVRGVHGQVLEPSEVVRGESSSRRATSEFVHNARAVIISSGGIGGNHELVRRCWPEPRLGPAPSFLLSGVPEHVDGHLQQAVHQAGASLINADRMWHYTEGLRNWNPIWPAHGIRILPGPSSLWLDPTGKRLPFPHVPGVDTLSTLQFISTHRHPYTWFLLNRAIIKREFALSGSEQNPDLTGKSLWLTLRRIGKSVQPPVQAFMDKGADFLVRANLRDLVAGMNALTGDGRVDYATVEQEILNRDAQVLSEASDDPQLAVVRHARKILSERLVRVARPAPILDPADGPLIAVRLNILTRKSLGGLETDLQARVLRPDGEPIPGLYAAGEVAGFGGGGVHGYRALEGTFLGGCLYGGRIAGARPLKPRGEIMNGSRYDVAIVGAGPNGLTAAAVLSLAGLSVIVLDRNPTVGGSCRTLPLTLPGFAHDICSAIHPMGAVSPIFRRLGLTGNGLEWVAAPLPLAHPLDDGRVALLSRSMPETAASLDGDGGTWVRLLEPFVNRHEDFFSGILRPVRLPGHPLLMARFGRVGLLSSDHLARRFAGVAARALFAGNAAHSCLALDAPASASIGLVLAIAGHAVDWPCARGGSQAIAEALAARALSSGCAIHTDVHVRSLGDIPDSRAVLLDVTPRQLHAIAADVLAAPYRRQLRGFRYGPAAFKIDYALSAKIPWRSSRCADAATVHVGGSYEEIARSEADATAGRISDAPFVLVAQQSHVDDTRAPAGRHTGWAYCHVPNGSPVDMTDRIERQIERFAPGFRDTILARHVTPPAALEAHNPNLVGGDIGGGANTLGQVLLRPVPRWNPYTTSNPRLFLCSSSTPPGGGVHGMCGYWAARTVLRRVFRRELPPELLI